MKLALDVIIKNLILLFENKYMICFALKFTFTYFTVDMKGLKNKTK